MEALDTETNCTIWKRWAERADSKINVIGKDRLKLPLNVQIKSQFS